MRLNDELWSIVPIPKYLCNVDKLSKNKANHGSNSRLHETIKHFSLMPFDASKFTCRWWSDYAFKVAFPLNKYCIQDYTGLA